MVNSMNDKGFTLVELIVTIGIIAMLGLVIGTNMVGIFSREEDRAYNDFVKEIEEAGCMIANLYRSESGSKLEQRPVDEKEYYGGCRIGHTCYIDVQDMIDRGYIDENLKDPNTGELVKSNNEKYRVLMKWVNNERICSMVGKE